MMGGAEEGPVSGSVGLECWDHRERRCDVTSRGWQGQVVGVLRVSGRTLEMLQGVSGLRMTACGLHVKQTEEARMENRLWEARVKARGQPGRWRTTVALDVGG